MGINSKIYKEFEQILILKNRLNRFLNFDNNSKFGNKFLTISIEDLRDEKLMAGLRKVMENAGVDRDTVERLFRSGEAVAAQGSFEGI